jgi:Na+/melibiose symporter-like transporter
MSRPFRGYGVVLLGLGSLISFGAALFNYFWVGNGIHGTPGALLVIVTTALMLLAAGALMFWSAMPRWLGGVLLFLILLDVVGSGFAAYLLEASWVVGAIALALLGWIVHLVAGPAQRPRRAEARS